MEKHLETKNYYFLVDIEEGDENGNTEMYDVKTNKLISDNCHATFYLNDILSGQTDEEITFISEDMKYNQIEMLKEIENN